MDPIKVASLISFEKLILHLSHVEYINEQSVHLQVLLVVFPRILESCRMESREVLLDLLAICDNGTTKHKYVQIRCKKELYSPPS